MKTDTQIQKDVMDQLKWEPFLHAAEIGVAVKNGIVTLSGRVDSFTKKLHAENAAKKIAGVKAIAEDIQIGVSPSYDKSDAEIAEAVVNALTWHAAVQQEKIKIKVENGNVVLEGEVEWEYERLGAKNAVENLAGVRAVTNAIVVKPRTIPSDIEQKINAAFHRSATIDANRVCAEVNGTKVVLRGTLRSSAEKEDARNAAWNVPGVTNVEDRMDIEMPEYI